MARKIVTEAVVEAKSDLTGKPATDVRQFTYNGATFTLDLTEAEAGVFDKAISKYTSKAQVEVSPDTLRSWAQSNGIAVGARGRIGSEVKDAYLTAMGAAPAKADEPTVSDEPVAETLPEVTDAE